MFVGTRETRMTAAMYDLRINSGETGRRWTEIVDITGLGIIPIDARVASTLGLVGIRVSILTIPTNHVSGPG